jgi:hypothetical protein
MTCCNANSAVVGDSHGFQAFGALIDLMPQIVGGKIQDRFVLGPR